MRSIHKKLILCPYRLVFVRTLSNWESEGRVKLPIGRGLGNEAEKAPAQAVPQSIVALRQI